MKHATGLRLSNMSVEEALKHADLHYQKAQNDLKIQEYLANFHEQSVMLSTDFIMATDIGLFIS